MNALSARGLNLRFGDKHILKELALEVATGEFFVIIGPNGSGKTTLLKALARLAQPDSGDIRLLDRSLADYSRRQLAQIMAVVPQQMPLDFPFTVAETVLMGRSPHLGLVGMEREEDFTLAEQAMKFTDVAHLSHRRLDQLSGGERQRVIIARAICQQPQVMLLDEPTASLDPAHQVHIMDLMERLRQEKNITVVMVSHDLNLAAMYGDKLLLLTDGTVLTVGAPQEVLTYEQLERSYGCVMLVDENSLGRVPRVMPVPGKFLKAEYAGRTNPDSDSR